MESINSSLDRSAGVYSVNKPCKWSVVKRNEIVMRRLRMKSGWNRWSHKSAWPALKTTDHWSIWIRQMRNKNISWKSSISPKPSSRIPRKANRRTNSSRSARETRKTQDSTLEKVSNPQRQTPANDRESTISQRHTSLSSSHRRRNRARCSLKVGTRATSWLDAQSGDFNDAR